MQTAEGRIKTATDEEVISRMRQKAEDMESANPLWIVVFGTYTWQFVAFPRFDVPKGTMAVASYPPALTAKMRAIERAWWWQRWDSP